MSLHSNQVLNHKIENYTYANAAAHTSASGFVTADLGKIAYQSDDGSYWRLTATTPTWAALGGGGAAITRYFESFKQFDIDQTAAAETIHQGDGSGFGLTVPGGTLNGGAPIGIMAIRFQCWGQIKNGTTAITFTPRIRWNSVNTLAGSPTTVLTGPPIVSTTTALSNKKFYLEAMVTRISSTNLAASMMIVNHTEDAGGLAKVNCEDNGAAGVNVGSFASDRFISLTWQMSATTGAPEIETFYGSIEFIPISPNSA